MGQLPKFNTENEDHNSHSTVKNETYDVLMEIPAIQGELEFYSFLKQRFEQQYETFIGFNTLNAQITRQI